MNNKKLWYPAAMVIALSAAFGTVHAKSLEQVGAAEASAEPLKTYGVDVSAKSGLKALLPAGWNLFIYKDTDLPKKISWSVGDTWISAIEKFADRNELAVRLDWSKKAVYVSSPEVAIEARAKLAEIDNAARTPLPTYAPVTTVARATLPGATVVRVTQPVATVAHASPPVVRVTEKTTVVAVTSTSTSTSSSVAAPAGETRISSDVLARALAATAPARPMPAAATAPVVAMPALAAASPVSRPAIPLPMPLTVVPSAPAPVAQPTLPVSGSDAFAHGNMEDVVRKTAAKLGYTVSWETITLPITGPVTFLGVDAAEDMRLLQKSLGRQSPIAIEVYRGSSVIRITPSSYGKESLAVYDSTYSGLLGYGQRPNTMIASAPTTAPAFTASTQQTMMDRIPTATLSPAAFPTAMAAPVVVAVPVVQVVKVVAPMAPTMLSMHVAKGDSLSKTIALFLKTQGWELKWQVPSDMEANFPFDAKGTTVAQVLKTLLPKLGLDTEMYAQSKMVVVHPIANTAE